MVTENNRVSEGRNVSSFGRLWTPLCLQLPLGSKSLQSVCPVMKYSFAKVGILLCVVLASFNVYLFFLQLYDKATLWQVSSSLKWGQESLAYPVCWAFRSSDVVIFMVFVIT